MLKTLVFLLAFISISRASVGAADSKPLLAAEAAPVVEAVPIPSMDPKDVPGTKVGKGPEKRVEGTSRDLNKTEKSYEDKDCHMVKGALKCTPKKVKRKTID